MSRLPHPTRISEYKDNEEYYPREIVESDGKIYLRNADGSLTLLSKVNPANIDADGYAVGGRLDLIARQNNPFTSISKTFGLTGSPTDESEFLIETSRDGGITWKDAKEDYMEYFSASELDYYASCELMFNAPFFTASMMGFEGIPLGGYADLTEGEELTNFRLRISIKPISRIGHIDCVKHTYMCNGDLTAGILFDLEYCTVENPSAFINILKDAPLKGGMAIGDGQYIGDGIHYFPEMKIGFGGDLDPQSSPMDPLVYRITYRIDKPSSLGLICGIEFYGNDVAIPIGNGDYLAMLYMGKGAYVPLTETLKESMNDNDLNNISGVVLYNEGTAINADLLGTAAAAKKAAIADLARVADSAQECQKAELANELSDNARSSKIHYNENKYPYSGVVYEALKSKHETLRAGVNVEASSWSEYYSNSNDKDIKYKATVNINFYEKKCTASDIKSIMLEVPSNIQPLENYGNKKYVDFILRYIYDAQISNSATTTNLILYSKVKPTKTLTINLSCIMQNNSWI